MKIGNLEIHTYKLDGQKKHGLYSDCEGCPFGYDSYSYEGECEDCGCYIDHDFDVHPIICAIPYKLKKLIKKLKGWEE